MGLCSYREKLSGLLQRRAVTAASDLAIGSAEYVVIDTELTGLDVKKDSIVSIGAVRMRGGRIDLGKTFYRLIRPATTLEGGSVVIHGITPSDVAGMPPMEDVIAGLADFCGEDVIVGHFILLDMGFINKDMRRILGGTMKNPLVDTGRIHEWMRAHDGRFSRHFGGYSEDLNLFALAKKYQIPFSGAHNAINDAFVTAQLFQRFLSFLPSLGVRTLGDLLRIGRP